MVFFYYLNFLCLFKTKSALECYENVCGNKDICVALTSSVTINTKNQHPKSDETLSITI